MSISIIIPSYKNESQLIDNLKHNLPFIKTNEIVIVNDNPEVSLKNELALFQNIILIENKKNLGFGQSVNIGAKVTHNQFIMLLNSDVILHTADYEIALNHFEKDDQLFAVSFAQKENDKQIVGKNIVYWQNGFFHHQKAKELSFGINGWAEGGSCLICKSKFLELGGFDPLYSPFYWEDVDLSYRAWKKGYHILFEPKIIVEHHHESTIGRYFSKSFVHRISYRNQILFIWKNIKDKKILLDHFVHFPKIILINLLKHNNSFTTGLLSALSRIGQIHYNNKAILTDSEVLNKFSSSKL